MNVVTLLGVLLLYLLFGCLLLVSIVWSAVHLFKNVSQQRIASLLPACVNVLTILTLIYLSNANIPIYADFHLKINQREQVVSMIRSKELWPNVSYNKNLIQLPFPYSLLADEGTIQIENDGATMSVLFYMFRGLGPDDFSGFVYMPDSKEPPADDFFGTTTRIIRLQEHWFWVDFD